MLLVLSDASWFREIFTLVSKMYGCCWVSLSISGTVASLTLPLCSNFSGESDWFVTLDVLRLEAFAIPFFFIPFSLIFLVLSIAAVKFVFPWKIFSLVHLDNQDKTLHTHWQLMCGSKSYTMQIYDSRIVNGFDFCPSVRLCAVFFSLEKLLTLNILGCDDASLHIPFLSFKSSFAFLNAAFTVWSGMISSGRFNALYLL